MTEPLTSALMLDTERLTLHGQERSDLPEVTRFMTYSPILEKQGETIIHARW